MTLVAKCVTTTATKVVTRSASCALLALKQKQYRKPSRFCQPKKMKKKTMLLVVDSSYYLMPHLSSRRVTFKSTFRVLASPAFFIAEF